MGTRRTASAGVAHRSSASRNRIALRGGSRGVRALSKRLWQLGRSGWTGRSAAYNSQRAYNRYLDRCLKKHRGNRDLAFVEAIGAASLDTFRTQGDGHVEVLRRYGLADGMSIFDVGCGCGRTAQALVRSGWRGDYSGTDVVGRFVTELKRKCPGYKAFVHAEPSISADDRSLDMVFHWSMVTHVPVEECYLSIEDTFRALKPGGCLVFSFLELTEHAHHKLFFDRVARVRRGRDPILMDTFLHRDWIAEFARIVGFATPEFTDGSDGTHHAPFWQTLVAMRKPL